MSSLVAVIDLGKTNSKLALVDTTRAQEVEVVTQPTPIRTDGLYPCIDHQAIEAFVVDALHTVCRSHDVDGLTVATHGATGALVNESGQLVLPVLDYEFDGIDEIRSDYDNLRPAFNETGSPGLPNGLNLGAQLYWQQTRFNSEFAQATTFLTWPQYWICQLSGARHNDVTSLGCHTDLYNPRKQCYSTLVDRLNLTALMPMAQASGQRCGQLKASLCNSIGCRSDLPVYTGIHDSNASLVPHLVAQQAPFSVVSTGTWFISMAIGTKDVALDEKRDTLYNINAMGQAVPSARFMGGRERQLLTHSGIDRRDVMNLLSNQHTRSGIELPGMLMPSTVAQTGPYPECNACWIDEPVGDKALRDCLIALYLALMTAECLQLIGAHGPTFIEGPLADDTLYAQMLSVATQRPVRISNSETGTSVGAAMLIKAPDSLPQNRHIEVDSSMQGFLESYASRWRQHLHNYAR